MNSDYDPDSFYPYRIQEEQGTTVPVVDSQHEHTPLKKRLSPLIIALLIIGVLFLFILSYNAYARRRIRLSTNLTPTQPSNTPMPTFTPIPTQKVSQFSSPALQAAYNQTLAAQTLKAAFVSQVQTKNVKTTGEESTIDSQVEGYLFGASDGKTIQTELRITYSADPGRSAFFGQILVDNRLFMKVNENNWIERDKSDYNKLYENQPIDATAYAYNMLDTLFTNSKALLRGIDTTSVKQEPDEQIDNKPVQVYSSTLSIPDYIDALQKDSHTTLFTLEDARKILANAAFTGRLYVDPSTNYIIRISLNGTNLTQISTEQSQQLGQTTTHTMNMVANLVDFNAPLSLKAP